MVIIAAGCWSGQVGRLAGVEIPVFPRRRCKFITAPLPAERIPLETPFIIDHHDGFSIRREGPGIMVGYGRKGEASTFDTAPDWDLVPAVAERAVRRVPALEDAPVMRAWAGLYEMTPDQMGYFRPFAGWISQTVRGITVILMSVYQVTLWNFIHTISRTPSSS